MTPPAGPEAHGAVAVVALLPAGAALVGCAAGPPDRPSPPIPDERLDLAELVGARCHPAARRPEHTTADGQSPRGGVCSTRLGVTDNAVLVVATEIISQIRASTG